MKTNNFIASLPIWPFYLLALAGIATTITVDWFIQQDWENAVIRSVAGVLFVGYAHVIINYCRKERERSRTEATT